jgi:beta-glucosidase
VTAANRSASAGDDDTAPDRFPADFLIGASTAAHQIEGNNVNSTWWALEHRPNTLVAEPSGDAADSLHRWPDDLDLVRSLGYDAYRFSIEWARIEPAPGEFSRAMIQHYGRIIDGAIERGIVPVVTLHHFTEPLWFAKAGGWRGEVAADRFVRYVEALEPILQPVPWIVTINEPNMVASALGAVRRLTDGETFVDDVPGAPLGPPDAEVAAALSAAHHQACSRLRELVPAAKTGWTIANQVVQSVPGGEQHAARYRERIEDAFLRESRADDFVGVQTYTRNVFGPDGPVRDDPPETRTLMGWEYYPETVEHAVRHARDVVGDVPVLVTENGIATADDTRRIAYTRGALQGLQRAMADGIDVRGYLHWSLLDNYEWGSYRPTFGLVGWEPESFDRTPKPSAYWLGEVARTRCVR